MSNRLLSRGYGAETRELLATLGHDGVIPSLYGCWPGAILASLSENPEDGHEAATAKTGALIWFGEAPTTSDARVTMSRLLASARFSL